jgi:predicted nucleic acid-binding protein
LAFYYLETSALVKLYVREAGTDRLLRLADRSSANRFCILSLAQVELWSAIRRRERNGEIPSVIATQILEAFRRHAESRFVTQKITDFLLDMASTLVDRHALRAFDAIQLAGFMVLMSGTANDAPFFVCADRDLLIAAEREGAQILDPCS